MHADRPPDLARTILQLLVLGALIVSSFWIVRPFLVASIWAKIRPIKGVSPRSPPDRDYRAARRSVTTDHDSDRRAVLRT